MFKFLLIIFTVFIVFDEINTINYVDNYDVKQLYLKRGFKIEKKHDILNVRTKLKIDSNFKFIFKFSRKKYGFIQLI